jgi:hypothetical protein
MKGQGDRCWVLCTWPTERPLPAGASVFVAATAFCPCRAYNEFGPRGKAAENVLPPNERLAAGAVFCPLPPVRIMSVAPVARLLTR